MSFKQRLYCLSQRPQVTPAELRAFVFIVLNCVGVEGPLPCERRSSSRHRSDLFNCREFSHMNGDQVLHFQSPSRKHFTQGLLEVDNEFAAMYNENKFRGPRKVLKAVYGCSLTVDEAMTLGLSAIAEVLAEEPGSVMGADAQFTPATLSKPIPGIADVHLSNAFRNPNGGRNRTIDGSRMLEFLSELRMEDEKRLAITPASDDSKSPKPIVMENGHKSDCTEEETLVEADVDPFKDDMDYLKDGIDVVQEACKVQNFREKSNEEDRYTSTKRPVEALQREANAKLRKEVNLFTRRLTKSTQVGGFLNDMVLDYVAELSTELGLSMESARSYSPKIVTESVILSKKMEELVLRRVQKFEVFRRVRREVRHFIFSNRWCALLWLRRDRSILMDS